MNLKNIDYSLINKELIRLYNSDNFSDKEELAYHYGILGFNSIAYKFLSEINAEKIHINRHLADLDSLYFAEELAEKISNNIFDDIPRGNWNFKFIDELEIVLPNNDSDISSIINIIPYLEILKQKNFIDRVKIKCSDIFKNLFSKFFDYIEIGSSETKTLTFEVIEFCEKNYPGELNKSITNISKKISNKPKKYVGVSWFSNKIWERHKSIPIGVLINTIGNHTNDYDVKSVQYNYPDIEIEIYNRYSKNKIIDRFDSKINVDILEVVEGISDCKMYLGISNTFANVSAYLLDIPTIVTSSTPSMYWYWMNGLNKNVKIARMRFQGDFLHITNTINDLL